ncbi:MAG: hypothetical protein WCP45_00505 [Verrucomicrobiota bacterium]
MIHRRDILRGCLRCGGLLALGGGAAALGWRSLHVTCPRTDPCGGCPLFSACGLPKALDAKSQKCPAATRAAAKPIGSHV